MDKSRKKLERGVESASGEFSEWELDAARQLVQLSVSGSNSAYEDDVNNHEASSALRLIVAAADDEWQPLNQRTKKFRSVEQIYGSTLRLDRLDNKKMKRKRKSK